MRDARSAPVEPGAGNDWWVGLADPLQHDYRRLTGRALLASAGDPVGTARALYEAPFVVLAHDTRADPCFTYANLAAQALFEIPWGEFIGMPSRLSAEPVARAEREALLRRVATHGYIDDYCGIRIARSGRRFRIERATVWNLIDPTGDPAGQAAMFGSWSPVDA